MLQKNAQQVELLAGQGQLHPGCRGRARLGRQGDGPAGQPAKFLSRRARRSLGGPGGAAQKRVHPRDELHHAEGLRQVIVGPGVEPAHFVELGALGGEHHNGDVLGGCVRAQLLHEAQAAFSGQHDVQQRRGGSLLAASLDEARSIGEGPHLEAGVAQGIARQIANVLIVFYVIYECRRSHGSPFSSACRIVSHAASAEEARPQVVNKLTGPRLQEADSKRRVADSEAIGRCRAYAAAVSGAKGVSATGLRGRRGRRGWSGSTAMTMRTMSDTRGSHSRVMVTLNRVCALAI